MDPAAVNAARLRWRCRRGMRELDALLEAFLKQGFATLDEADLQRFAAFLELPDPDLHAYLVGHYEPADPGMLRLIQLIRRSIVSES